MQSSFSDLEYAAKKKQTRRDRFLSEIEAVTPWPSLLNVVAPHYPASGKRGHPPIGLERILRMYIVQQCFGFSDEGTEDAVYDSQAIRRFVGIDLNRESGIGTGCDDSAEISSPAGRTPTDRIHLQCDQRPPG